MNATLANAILREEAAAAAGQVDPGWEAKVERLSQLCEDGMSRTHIAFLGTEMLAKAVDARADLRAIKPTLDPKNPNAYSARSLCHGVLVPLSAELGFSLGVSGREPLNNQPYFRMNHLGDAAPVHNGAQPAFDFMISLIDQLQQGSSADARQALRAFVVVRSRYQKRYGAAAAETIAITPNKLLRAIRQLVAANSEGGRRAQAAAAGLLDVVAGTGRVESGRINDPSRHYPGDVAVLAVETAEGGVEVFEKAFEVRDKPARFSDVALFGRTCADRGVREAAMVLVSDAQRAIEPEEVRQWSASIGISMTLFIGWESFVDQCLFWAPSPKFEAATLARETIRERLIGVEASAVAVDMWDDLAI